MQIPAKSIVGTKNGQTVTRPLLWTRAIPESHTHSLWCVDYNVGFRSLIWHWSQRSRSNVLKICIVALNMTSSFNTCSRMIIIYLAQWLLMVKRWQRRWCVKDSACFGSPIWHWSKISNEPWHEISNNVVCATSKASDQPAHTRSLIRAFASRLNILWVLSYWLSIIWSF